MSTQRDIYVVSSENRPPMLNKDNYVPWSSHLLRYANSKPNKKLLEKSILHGPYTDDELTEKDAKQVEADDQAIQIILMGLPKDVYAILDSYQTARETWERSTITHHLHATSTTQQKLCPTTSIQHELHATPMPNPEDISDPTTAMNMALVNTDRCKWLEVMVGISIDSMMGRMPEIRLGTIQGIRMGITNYNGNGNVVAARAEGNGNGNNANQIRCYNCRGMGHYARNCTVRPRRRDVAYLQTQLLIAQKEEAGIQLQAEEFVMVAAGACEEIEEVNANCIFNGKFAASIDIEYSY
ncbi:retrovirus-related pol polyprotein from transposon TNT 1-94 [Tanacetum coccineum]